MLAQFAERLQEIDSLLVESKKLYQDSKDENDEDWIGNDERDRNEESIKLERISGEEEEGVRRTAIKRSVKMRRYQKAGILPPGVRYGALVKSRRRRSKESLTRHGIQGELAEDGWELV